MIFAIPLRRASRWVAIILLLAASWHASAQQNKSAAEIKKAADKARQNALLQKSFSKILAAKFEKGTNDFAKIQRILTKGTNTLLWEGHTYCGTRFTIPTWIDGDFAWMFCFAKSAAEKDFVLPDIHWFILAREGTNEGFNDYVPDKVKDYPVMQREFPYTGVLIRQYLEKQAFKPGAEYAIWFNFLPTNKIPDIGFCMTIESPRGDREAGRLPTPK